MLLSFPNRDHADVLAGEGCLHIGGGSDNDVVLAQLRDRHARLTLDARGIVLEILDAGGRAHVNARPVRERAFVRYGDTVCLDAVTIAVSEPDHEDITVAERLEPDAPLRGVLRGMSGMAFGKSYPMGHGVMVGRRADGSIELGSSISGTALARISGSAGEPVITSDEPDGSQVNGRMRAQARLRSGDQIVFGRERFIVECCSSPAPSVALPPTPVDEVTDETMDPVAEQGSAGYAVWWLIAAAGTIGLVLAAVLRQGA